MIVVRWLAGWLVLLLICQIMHCALCEFCKLRWLISVRFIIYNFSFRLSSSFTFLNRVNAICTHFVTDNRVQSRLVCVCLIWSKVTFASRSLPGHWCLIENHKMFACHTHTFFWLIKLSCLKCVLFLINIINFATMILFRKFFFH